MNNPARALAHLSIAKPLKRLCSILLVTLMPLNALYAQSPESVKEAREHQRLAIEAFRNGDNASFLKHVKEAVELRPSHPGLMYNLAVGHALSENSREAIAWLEKYAATGSAANIVDSDHFTALREEKMFKEVAARIAKNSQPVGDSVPAFFIEEADILAEGIAHDPATRSFFVSSVHKRKVIQIDADGSHRDFIPTGMAGLSGALAIAADSENRILWVCSAGVDQVANQDSSETAETSLFKFDLDTGEFLSQYRPDDADDGVIGDITVGPDGTVFVSNGQTGIVYFLSPGSDQLVALTKAGALVSPQGLALDESGQTLFVADYSLGIARISLPSGAVEIAGRPDGQTLLGIDGLVRIGGSLVGIQNGINPQRVVKMTLNDRGDVEALTVLEANNPVFDEPTQAVVADGFLFYIANSQWSLFGADGVVVPGAIPKATAVLRLEL